MSIFSFILKGFDKGNKRNLLSRKKIVDNPSKSHTLNPKGTRIISPSKNRPKYHFKDIEVV